MVETQKQKVLITGITGFLGSWVTEIFLRDGRFEIRGTVRSKLNKDKL
jgi:nucleoside-diphosphate-sugar epimerase